MGSTLYNFSLSDCVPSWSAVKAHGSGFKTTSSRRQGEIFKEQIIPHLSAVGSLMSVREASASSPCWTQDKLDHRSDLVWKFLWLYNFERERSTVLSHSFLHPLTTALILQLLSLPGSDFLTRVLLKSVCGW